uniref:Uncharacterized protein n=1 Tax=Siphoviridae sp. ctNnX9 TaxID=2827859 RepID=A0A8S5TEC0_9CAUD|nr:MAG TPA: hypothetical protein [Siphoviridae sp. ctNnX9]
MRRNEMINIREIRIGDIITRADKYEGYKYSIVEGIDNISGTIRHREVYEDGGRQMAISSYEDMSPFPLSEGLLKAYGWQKSLNGVNVLFADFEPISIGLRPSAVSHNAFCPILLPDDSRRMHDAMFMYEIESVHELQALLDMWKIRDILRTRVKIIP